ncbi:hypothetical protein B0T24DRAFT_683881 [Lasiosphaeria ovina]|uniref:Uncharacterized protein n=1 Tax=Lasiosphaeria ovina TaxID=92902 RepID=A0AAE0JWJ2_9PEZI|nr:hypothetical protein B0T24DRAFT_683881 [Lasiosphaeria ovina]
MFCTIDNNHSHHRSILSSFRSQKALKADMPRGREIHFRKPSDASSMTRSSTDSSRPSTSRTDMSVEWDPLRLHPPLAPAPTPAFNNLESRRYQPHELRQARSAHGVSLSSVSHRSHPEASMVIYDGFDFGFGHPSAGGQREPRHHDHDAPSESGSDDEVATPSSQEVITPRPQAAVLNETDYFMKRGDWKRRGIIFTPDVSLATEDDCFNLDVDMMH